MNIVRQLIEIILNKRAPENIDHSINAAVIASATCLLTYFSIYSLFEEFSQPLLYSIIHTAAYLLGFIVLLKIHGKENRFVQTVTVFFGTSFILTCGVFFLIATQYLAILSIAILIYSFIIKLRILKSAFSCPNYLAVVILISISIFSSAMVTIVSPQAGVESNAMVKNLQIAIEQAEQSQKNNKQ